MSPPQIPSPQPLPLMSYRVLSVLLVCSSYDQFTLDEDGQIERQLQQEYRGYALSEPPRFTRIDSAHGALELLAQHPDGFDLVISMFHIGGVSPFEFSELFKAQFPAIPLVLLTSFSHEINRRMMVERTEFFDYIFAWQGSVDLLLGIIKMVEDRANAAVDMGCHGVQAVLLVEDNIRFYSAYLPDLYRIVLEQTELASSEALNQSQRSVQKRSRPKILFARSMSEAVYFFSRFSGNLLGVISDVSFPGEYGGVAVERAGLDFCGYLRSVDSTLPILLQSSQESMSVAALELGVSFVCKHSAGLFGSLKEFVHRQMAFGDFQFLSLSQPPQVLFSPSNLEQMQHALELLPCDVLLHYSAANMYSKWLKARGLFDLARTIRSLNIEDFMSIDSPSSAPPVEQLRTALVGAVKSYRRQIGRGVIAEFSTQSYSPYITFARCGTGSLGGKARGLAFVGSIIENHNLYERFEGVLLTIPRTLVVSSGYFDEFLTQNEIGYVATEAAETSGGLSDTEILALFVGCDLPEQLEAELRVFLSQVERPLAVRSSSKLEDSHYQPFAGIYSTYMVARAEDSEDDLRQVSRAIKSVYASVFYTGSRAYIDSTSNTVEQESMGVVIQEICGSADRGLYFPTFSGVAQSVNFYPLEGERAEDGVCKVVLGLGKSVVEGGVSLRFSPTQPRRSLQLSSMEVTLRSTQRRFLALDIGKRFDNQMVSLSADDSLSLTEVEVSAAVDFRNMRHVASWWDMQDNRMVDGFSPTLRRPYVTFASVLKYSTFPLCDILNTLLKIGEREMQSPVEIEFAVNMDVPVGERMVFNLLQIRPMVSLNRGDSLRWESVDTAGSLLLSNRALGVGQIRGVRHIVYVPVERFDPAHTVEIATEVDHINSVLQQSGARYVLVGPGRWGSSDRWLGVPVKWAQISGSAVIVERNIEGFRVDASQGTHFFQNVTSLGVGYLTLDQANGDGSFDQALLDSMESIYHGDFVRCVEFTDDLYIFVDGRNSRAIIR